MFKKLKYRSVDKSVKKWCKKEGIAGAEVDAYIELGRCAHDINLSGIFTGWLAAMVGWAVGELLARKYKKNKKEAK